jgi:hypothetical protein
MPKCYETKNGKTVEYDIGEAQCPKCEWPVVGYFQNGELVKIGPCPMCSNHKEPSEWVQ